MQVVEVQESDLKVSGKMGSVRFPSPSVLLLYEDLKSSDFNIYQWSCGKQVQHWLLAIQSQAQDFKLLSFEKRLKGTSVQFPAPS